MIAIVICLAVFGGFVGLSQKIVWSFIAGFAVAEAIQFLLKKYFNMGLGIYGSGMMISFFLGVVFAFLAQSRDSSQWY